LKNIILIALLLAMGLLLSGCATMINRDGFSLVQSDWERQEADLRARASFELSCAADQLTVHVLTTMPAYENYAQQVGVTGCEKKAVYVRTVSGWVANSSSGESH
jgi:hypothetical protein